MTSSTGNLSATALYVEGSKINVGTEDNSTASLTLYHYDSNETSNAAQGGAQSP